MTLLLSYLALWDNCMMENNWLQPISDIMQAYSMKQHTSTADPNSDYASVNLHKYD